MHLNSVKFLAERFPDRTCYPFRLPIFQKTPGLALDAPVTFFVGENGTGKSTLLEGIAVKCGIHIWRDVERQRVDRNPYERSFGQYLEVAWNDGPVPGSFFSGNLFHYFAESLDDWAASDPGLLRHFGGKSLVTQSHGQSLMSYFSSRYRIRGLYLLDEPETALSPKTQLQLLDILTEMSRAGHAQFIVATHSPILMACPDAVIYSFDRAPIAPIRYHDSEHFNVYKDFLYRIDSVRA